MLSAANPQQSGKPLPPLLIGEGMPTFRTPKVLKVPKVL